MKKVLLKPSSSDKQINYNNKNNSKDLEFLLANQQNSMKLDNAVRSCYDIEDNSKKIMTKLNI